MNQARQLIATLARSEKFRFLAVGGWNTFFGYLAFVWSYVLLQDSANIHAILIVSYIVATLQSFTTQKLFVFRTGGQPALQLVRFCISNTAIFTANMLILPTAIDLSGLSPILVQAFFVGASTVATYYLHKHFSFN